LDDAITTEPFVYRESDELILKNVANSTLISFNVPFVPFLENLPVRLEQEFISQLASLAVSQ
jgi:hypothetical protein